MKSRPVLIVCLFVLLSAGCIKPVPMVAIPGSDASPPTLTWQTYNVVTKERKDIAQDGQTIEVAGSDQYVVTLMVEDPESGVKNASLTGHVQFKCELGGQVEEKKYDLEPQETKTTPNHENQVAVSSIDLCRRVQQARMQRAGDLRRWHAVFDGEGPQLREWWGNKDVTDEFEEANRTVKRRFPRLTTSLFSVS